MLNMPNIIYTKNWVILGKIEGGVDFFAQTWGTRFFWKIGKKTGPFRPQSTQFFTIDFLKTQSIKSTSLRILTKF